MPTTYIITESGDKLLTENGDYLITEASTEMSIRYDIIQEFKSILEDIDSVNFVSDKLKIEHPQELDGDELPACFILDETETKEALTIFSDGGDDMTSVFSVSVTSIVFDREGDTLLARTNLMVAIEAAIVTDADLIAMLIMAPSPETVETDQGYFGNYSVFKQTFSCQYTYAHATGGD